MMTTMSNCVQQTKQRSTAKAVLNQRVFLLLYNVFLFVFASTRKKIDN